MRRVVVCSLMALVLVPPLGAALAPQVQASQASHSSEGGGPPLRLALGDGFVAMKCPDRAYPKKLDVDCGYVRVPQDRSRPHGRMITVAAAVVHARSAQPAAEPILVLPGGPSFGGISQFYYRFYFKGSSWARDHDLVFVDTRGTGLTKPRLGCPEVDRAYVDFFYSKPFVGSRALQTLGGALRECRQRLARRGIDPAAYTTSASVADLEALRTALGVKQWNLLSISADGLLGMSYVRAHPESIRATIVDSGMSPQMMGLLDYERGLAEMLEAIFAGCAANKACRSAYPHLRREFMQLVARLNKHPRIIRFPDFRPHPVRLRLDGMGLYKDVISQIFPGNVFVPEDIHRLINDMWRASHGELAEVYREMFGTGPVTNEHTDRFVAFGRTMSTECHDITAFITAGERRRAARDLPMFAKRYLSRSFDLGLGFGDPRSPAGCQIWGVGRANPKQHRPVVSSVPTLVLAGEYDAGVPPYVVRQVDDRLSRATYVEFPASAHLQLASFTPASECARAIGQAFLASPLTAPDTSCVEALPAFDFTPPRPRERSAAACGRTAVWLSPPVTPYVC